MKLVASSSVILGSLLLGLMGCQGKEATAPPATTAASPLQPSGETTPVVDETSSQGAQAARDGKDAVAGPSSDPQMGTLVAQEADAQINVRSQPSTHSNNQGYGVVGDAVKLLKATQDEEGLTWHYVQFAESGTEGWIRGDFIKKSDTPPRCSATPNGGSGECRC